MKLLIITISLDCTEYRNLVAQLHRGIEILLHVCTHAYDSDRRAPGPVLICKLICFTDISLLLWFIGHDFLLMSPKKTNHK